MKVKDLIEKLKNFDSEAYIYINYEQNFEDEFFIKIADTNNVLLIPVAKFKELSNSQEFSFLED